MAMKGNHLLENTIVVSASALMASWLERRVLWIMALILTIFGYAEHSYGWTQPLRLVFADFLVAGTEGEVKFSRIRSFLVQDTQTLPSRSISSDWIQARTLEVKPISHELESPLLPEEIAELGLDLWSQLTGYPYGVDMPSGYVEKRTGPGRVLLVAPFNDETYLYAAYRIKNGKDEGVFDQVVLDIFKKDEITNQAKCFNAMFDVLRQFPSKFSVPLHSEIVTCDTFEAYISDSQRFVRGRLYVLESPGGQKTAHILVISATGLGRDNHKSDHDLFLRSLTPVYPDFSPGNAEESAPVDPSVTLSPEDGVQDNPSDSTELDKPTSQTDTFSPIPVEPDNLNNGDSSLQGKDIDSRRRELEIDYNFFNSLADEVFYDRNPDLKGRKISNNESILIGEWRSIASTILDNLETLPSERRSKLGKYDHGQYRKWINDLSAWNNQKTEEVKNTADESFYSLFPDQRGRQLNRNTFGQVWLAIFEDEWSKRQSQ